jgi:hypothetical protein
MLNFRLDARIGHWVTDASFRGKPVRLQLTEHLPEESLPNAAEKVLAEVESRWESIERNLADSLLETYTKAWADPEEGLPVLTREEFLRKIVLTTVQVDVDDQGESITLYFHDSNLFAGHGVHLFWDSRKMHPADLIG